MNNDATVDAKSRTRVLPRKTDTQPALENLQQVAAYQAANAHVFGSVPSLNWFIRQHRDELLKAGALVQLAGRWLLDGPVFTQKVIEIGRKTAIARHA